MNQLRRNMAQTIAEHDRIEQEKREREEGVRLLQFAKSKEQRRAEFEAWLAEEDDDWMTKPSIGPGGPRTILRTR